MHVTSPTACSHFGDHQSVFESRETVTISQRATQDAVLSQSLQRNIFRVTLNYVRNVVARQADTRVDKFCVIYQIKSSFLTQNTKIFIMKVSLVREVIK